MSSIITPAIKEKIKAIAKDSTEAEFLLALLEWELDHVDKSSPNFKDDYRDVLENCYPYKEKQNSE